MAKLDSVIKISKVGETLILDNINFYGDSDKWLDSSLPAVNNLLNIMKTNKTLQIEIQGHICCNDNDVNDVSTKRAYAVYQLLINNGIEKNRLSYKGFGRTKPLVNEIDEPSRSKNRRVEIYIKWK
jgi:outer membrane protein OmpA-like peptidoglycan-associated protein